MQKALDFIKRHIIWLTIGCLAMLVLQPQIAEIKTLLLITAVESLALALSGIALYVYTKIDFTQYYPTANPGFIFLGVHVCVGLVVLGVYIAQFAN